MEEQLIQTEQFRKSYVPPRNILQFFQEQNVSVPLVPKKYTKLLQRLRKIGCRGKTWLKKFFVKVLNGVTRYNMPLLEVIGMTPTSKNFTVATAFMQNEQATTYR
ncbi:hypothetical protein M9H77_32025 [Catharanthus roseus]|uniref:Uncharacterized protein n=1 Tax=Catharanthus roseus TaxID=4058 RepID=A0ACC0A1T4_CATRO|nr:hypothetical protein M9H77_32025 [Catharanthus roseus]